MPDLDCTTGVTSLKVSVAQLPHIEECWPIQTNIHSNSQRYKSTLDMSEGKNNPVSLLSLNTARSCLSICATGATAADTIIDIAQRIPFSQKKACLYRCKVPSFLKAGTFSL